MFPNGLLQSAQFVLMYQLGRVEFLYSKSLVMRQLKLFIYTNCILCCVKVKYVSMWRRACSRVKKKDIVKITARAISRTERRWGVKKRLAFIWKSSALRIHNGQRLRLSQLMYRIHLVYLVRVCVCVHLLSSLPYYICIRLSNCCSEVFIICNGTFNFKLYIRDELHNIFLHIPLLTILLLLLLDSEQN